MAGEMHKEELEEGGEWYSVRKDMEEIGKKAGAIVKVEPYDQYQGPKGKVYFGAQYVGELWVGNFEKPYVWYFKPEINIKLLHSVKSAKMSKYVLVDYLKKLKESLPSHKPFAVIPGEKPANWSTPKLKKEQQKSLLHLVKSKYTIVER